MCTVSGSPAQPSSIPEISYELDLLEQLSKGTALDQVYPKIDEIKLLFERLPDEDKNRPEFNALRQQYENLTQEAEEWRQAYADHQAFLKEYRLRDIEWEEFQAENKKEDAKLELLEKEIAKLDLFFAENPFEETPL